MRYSIYENSYLLGKFDTGETVTIILYDLSDDSQIAINTNVCDEIGTTGVFKWSTTNITNYPTTFTDILYIMTDSLGNTVEGKFTIGGVIDLVMKYSKNATKIDPIAKQFIIYDDDGITPIRVFNLKDRDGNLSISETFEREVVS